ISLNARIGRNRFCIFSFPGKRKDIDQILDWSPKLDAISSVFPKLTSGGITPTGPAIREAMYQFGKKSLLRSLRRDESAWKKHDIQLRPGMHVKGKWHNKRYLIKKRLGQGAVGTVYLCEANGKR